jgi:hypothetical protein
MQVSYALNRVLCNFVQRGAKFCEESLQPRPLAL